MLSDNMQNFTFWPIPMASQAEMDSLMTCKIILHSQQSLLEHHHPEQTNTV
jgi:hypothetical protein